QREVAAIPKVPRQLVIPSEPGLLLDSE
uniref:Gag protein n=1 Tax=Globodera pallida TaxID=36090 RepID=A0A183CRG6_GLOPA